MALVSTIVGEPTGSTQLRVKSSCPANGETNIFWPPIGNALNDESTICAHSSRHALNCMFLISSKSPVRGETMISTALGVVLAANPSPFVPVWVVTVPNAETPGSSANALYTPDKTPAFAPVSGARSNNAAR